MPEAEPINQEVLFESKAKGKKKIQLFLAIINCQRATIVINITSNLSPQHTLFPKLSLLQPLCLSTFSHLALLPR